MAWCCPLCDGISKTLFYIDPWWGIESIYIAIVGRQRPALRRWCVSPWLADASVRAAIARQSCKRLAIYYKPSVLFVFATVRAVFTTVYVRSLRPRPRSMLLFSQSINVQSCRQNFKTDLIILVFLEWLIWWCCGRVKNIADDNLNIMLFSNEMM